MTDQGPARDRSHPSRTPLAEWSVGGLGLLAVAAMLAVLMTEAVAGGREPPLLTIAAGRAEQTAAGWRLPVQVRNGGDRTASGVQIEGDLGEETAQATLEHVPAQGSADAGLMFAADPRGRVRLRVTGYKVS